MIKQVISRLEMALVLLFGLHLSAPVSARVQGDEEPPVKIVDEVWGKDCYRICHNTVFFAHLVATGNQPVYDVSLKASLYDGHGNLLGSEIVYPSFEATLPGQFNSFGGGFIADYDNSFTHELSLNSYILTSSKEFASLEVVFLPPENEESTSKGYIFNPYTKTLDNIRLQNTTFNCYPGFNSYPRALGPIPPNSRYTLEMIGCLSGASQYNDVNLIAAQGQLVDRPSTPYSSYTNTLFLPFISRNDAQPLNLIHTWTWQDRDTRLFSFAGFIQNTFDKPIANATVKASAYDLSGTLLASEIFTADLPVILEGQIVSFQGKLNTPFESVTRTDFQILSSNPASDPNLVRLNVSFNENSDGTTAYVYNPYDKPIKNAAILYRNTALEFGYLIDLQSQQITQTILPGEIVTFTPKMWSFSYIQFIAGQGQLER